MLPSQSSIVRLCSMLAISAATCFAQYTGPGAIPSSALDFGSVIVNDKSVIQSITFSFVEAETIAHLRVGASGTNGLDFHHAGGTCKVGSSLSANQQCTVQVTFLPDHVGEIRGAVSLLDAKGHVFATGFVHGIGSGPRLSFPPGASSTIKGLDGVGSLAADSVGNVYVERTVPAGNGIEGRIYRITPAGAASIVYRQPGPILKLTSDGAGNLYYTAGPGGAMHKVAPDGSLTDFERDSTLDAIAIDGEGTVYVGDHGAIDRVSATGVVYLGAREVGLGDQGEVSITGLVVPSTGQRIFDANAGLNAGGPYLRGKIFQDPNGYATVAYDGGRQAELQDLALNPDGSLVAAVLGTITPVQSLVPVLPLDGYSVAVAANGDIFVANGSLTRLSRSSAPGLSFVAASRGEVVSATLSLTNTGNQPLLFNTDTAQITGPNAASFHFEGTTCDAQTGLLPGASCTATVSFQSTQSGLATATLSASTNDPAYGTNPVTVPLQGINP